MMRFHPRDLFHSPGDSLGILLSGACVAHCVLLPVVAFLSPVIATLIEAEWVHLSLLAVLAPLALITFYAGRKRHQSAGPLQWGAIGLALLFSALMAEGDHMTGLELETGLTVLGSLLLCYAHYQNFSLKKNCCHEQVT